MSRIEFIHPNPNFKARIELDRLLDSGVNRLAVAAAFCTEAGVQILGKHSERLRGENSFVVVSWEPPTDFDALEELHKLIRGHLYVHLGNTLPEERDAFRPIMHSKMFYAESGDQARLWVGSHNLTASATQGVNAEAGLVVTGKTSDQVFLDAIRHLETCRDEAVVFEPGMKGPGTPPTDKQQVLVVHAELDSTYEDRPNYIHLRLQDSTYDKDLQPPAEVRLYLYPPGSLKNGWHDQTPLYNLKGEVTGLNFTAHHPTSRGTAAEWDQADYVIVISGDIPHMKLTEPLDSNVTTQAVLRISRRLNERETWVKKRPTPKVEPEVIQKKMSIDRDMMRFFKKSSRDGNQLRFHPIKALRDVVELSRHFVPPFDIDLLSGREVGQVRRIEYRYLPEGKDKLSDPLGAFIYRATYRLR